MAISTKIIGGNGFNEGGGYVWDGTGTFASGQLVSGGINQDTMALPGDGNRHHVDGITASLSVAVTTAELVAAVAGRGLGSGVP